MAQGLDETMLAWRLARVVCFTLWESLSPPLHVLLALATMKVAVSGAAGVRRAASSHILLPGVPDFAQC